MLDGSVDFESANAIFVIVGYEDYQTGQYNLMYKASTTHTKEKTCKDLLWH